MVNNMNMYVFFITIWYLSIFLCSTVTNLYSQEFNLANNTLDETSNITELLETINQEESSETTATEQQEKLIVVDYKNTELALIINQIAKHKGVNIILPVGTASLKEKVTFKLNDPVSLSDMWTKILPMILDAADISMVPKDNMYVIVRNNNMVNREPFPLFIDNDIDDLPSSDERIRYIYYLSNMKINDGGNNSVTTILKALLPSDTQITPEPITNSIIITGRSSDIKGAMVIIQELDQVLFQEKMEIIHLTKTNATVVADLFNNFLLKSTDQSKYHLDTRKKSSETYFSPYVKIAPLKNQNALIILGRTQAVDRIKEFIFKYIDIELDSGNSVLHIYKLQYLDAKSFADVLRRIIDANKGNSGQSRGETGQSGPERFFDEVIIKSDTPIGGRESKQYYGGNKLIVACRNDDWVQIKKIIEIFDTPRRTVLIEMLIADLTINDDRLLGATTRNPYSLPLPSYINYQTAPISTIITNQPNPTTIQSDLLATGVFPPNAAGNSSLANLANPGTTLISLNDNNGATWSLINVAKSFGHAKIISHPHVITTNNTEAVIESGEERLLIGPGASTEGGAAVQKFEKIPAKLSVAITPRISSAENVNLNINIGISEFTNPSTVNPPRNNRTFITNANVDSGGIIVLGGLRVNTNSDAIQGDPLLSKLPIIGYLFKNHTKNLQETSLTIFISPTIIEPRLRSGVNEYTNDYVGTVKNFVDEGLLFDSLRDPITHWFFSHDNDPVKEISTFLSQDEFKQNFDKKNDIPSVSNNKQSAIEEKKQKKKNKNKKNGPPKKSSCDENNNEIIVEQSLEKNNIRASINLKELYADLPSEFIVHNKDILYSDNITSPTT